MRPQVITTAVMSDDADGISVSQKPAAGGVQSLTITGTLASGGVATIANAQRIGITSDDNDSGVTFAITGTDADKVVMTESGITGPSSNTILTTAYFKTVTGVTISGNATGNITVGTLAADGLVTASIRVNWRQTPFNLSIRAKQTGTIGSATFGAQYTMDAPEIHFPDTPYSNSFNTDADWDDMPDLHADINTSDTDTDVYAPVQAVRGKFTVGDTAVVVKFTVNQGDNR